MHVYVQALMWKLDADVKSHPPSLLHLIRRIRLSQSNPELTDMAGLASPLTGAGTIGKPPRLPAPSVSSGDLNSSPHACMLSAYTTISSAPDESLISSVFWKQDDQEVSCSLSSWLTHGHPIP